MDTDLLDSLLGLEDEFYNEGHALGSSDGARAGYLEGKAFGLEKAFEKFLEMGTIHGKATIWAKRLPRPSGERIRQPVKGLQMIPCEYDQEAPNQLSISAPPAPLLDRLSKVELPCLPPNPRLRKHINTLLALTDPTTLSTENTEKTIASFDGRLRKALAKVKVIEKIIGEPSGSELAETATTGEGGTVRKVREEGDGTGSIEDISSLHTRR
jgi:hypothetical protein